MIKINMGCGWRDFGEDWVHIDGGEYKHLDYKSISDLSQFGDGTVDLIYASHIIEYFDTEELEPLLEEWNRVLKAGGVLRVAVPDFAQISELYHSKNYTLDKFIGLLYGRMPMGTETIYHKMVYDFDLLKEVLELNGFSNIKKYDWRKTEHASFDDHSQAYLPHMDKENGTLMSLNIEGIK
jgi:predicted SAM-dependent methyltransferase